MADTTDTRYVFPINADGSVGSNRTVPLALLRASKYGDIIVRIADLSSGSYMARHGSSGQSVWEIDLNHNCNGMRFYRWDQDKERDQHIMTYDDFFAWLLEAYPAEHQFIIFNMEFFDNRFNLI